jgi:type VI secretion system ImpC/EvpB family protein
MDARVSPTDGRPSVTGDSPAPVVGQPGPPAAHGHELLDAVLRSTDVARDPAVAPLDQFLREHSPWAALRLWLRRHDLVAGRLRKADVVRILTRDIARIDELIAGQVNTIIHHPAFQKLESSWRGLQYLVAQQPDDANIKIRVLNLPWRELVRDQTRALEFDQSQLFRKVYEEEFGHPGGEPFSLLLGDYEIHHRPSPEHPHDDVEVLSKIASVAAAAFAPFVAAIHPSFLELESFADLERPLNLTGTIGQLDYIKWRAFRDAEDARFVGLTLPRVLVREPYADDASQALGFRFREDVDAGDSSRYLWGNASYAFGGVVMRSFAESGWLASIRGVRRGVVGGGLVTGLPSLPFHTDPGSRVTRCSTDVIITDDQEKALGDLGFIPLCHCFDTDSSAFYGNQSVQKPAEYDEVPATMSARLSAMLQYMLCVARFAHYLKVISRDKLGAFNGASELEDYLRKWLMNYTNTNDTAGPEVRAKYPLREAKVQIREQPGRPGSYSCTFHLRPHFQLDQLVASVRLRTELSPGRQA